MTEYLMARKDELDAHIADTDDPHGTTAGQVTVTPTGDIAATNVQDAIAELDSEKQPLDALLTALAALTTAANQLIYSTGSDTVSMTSLTAYARTLLDDADATTARATLDAEQAGTAAAAISTHEGEANPHPVYLTTAEGDSAYVANSLYDANTILAANSDDTPAALSIPASRVVGRESSGNIKAMTAAETKGVLGLANAALTDASNAWSAAQLMPDGSGIDEAAGQNSGPVWYTSASSRWQLARTGLAESGSDAGSNMGLFRYNDSGVFQGTAIEVQRSDGSVVLEGASGGFQGTGTINAAGLYVDGESVLHEGAIFESSEQSITANTILTVAHGLGARPRFAWVRMRCKTAELSYAVDDETDGQFSDGGATHSSTGPMPVRADATNLYFAFGNDPPRVVEQLASSSANWVTVTSGNWRLIFRAYL